MVTYGLNDRSRMNREVHVRFSEGPRVKFPRSTHPKKLWCFSALGRGGLASVISLFYSFCLCQVAKIYYVNFSIAIGVNNRY
jgi:hypothetical protein